MLRDDFFTDPNGGYPSFPRKRAFDRIWKKINDYEQVTGKSLDNGLAKTEWIELFNYMRIRQTVDFANIKAALVYYLNYICDHGGLSESSVGFLKEVYFDDLTLPFDKDTVVYYKNLEQLRDAINKTLVESGRIDNSAHDVAVSALYMAWFGIPIEEAIKVKKTDVSEAGLSVYGALLTPPDFVLEVWLRLRDSEGFYQQARNVILRKYVPSVYLLRTEKKDSFTPVLLRSLISRFNVVTNKRFSLSYDVVFRSGIFNRAYRLECESNDFPISDPEFAATVFETDVESMKDSVKKSAKIKDYEYYKQLFR